MYVANARRENIHVFERVTAIYLIVLYHLMWIEEWTKTSTKMTIETQKSLLYKYCDNNTRQYYLYTVHAHAYEDKIAQVRLHNNQ